MRIIILTDISYEEVEVSVMVDKILYFTKIDRPNGTYITFDSVTHILVKETPKEITKLINES